MQTRVCFNGGEYAPEMAMRSDMEQYYKGVAVMENWELSQMGGVRRRRGMRRVCAAMGAGSRLVPYVYSYAEGEGLRFVVEVAERAVRVLSEAGAVVKVFRSGVDGCEVFRLVPERVRFEQVKGWLFLTCEGQAPLVLELLDDNRGWALGRWRFERLPWRFDELRDTEVVVEPDGSEFAVRWDADEEDDARGLQEADTLRVSFWTEEQEAVCRADEVLAGVVVALKGVPDSAAVGDVFASPAAGESVKYWVCKEEFPGDVYVEGLDDPGCYPDNFVQSESMVGFDEVEAKYSVHDFISGGKIAKGAKLAIKGGYWEFWTCVAPFTKVAGESSRFADYTAFVRGVAVGAAMPCRGEWKFLCSGLWYGSYEVRRNYEGREVNGTWEPRGSSFSRVDEASNTVVSGTEADEVCYVRLFLTRSRRLAAEDLRAGFPQDSCGNRLVVEGYRHDMELRAQPGSSGKNEDVLWLCADKVQLVWRGARATRDWSWAAFGGKYGWPMLVGMFQGRLCFAATVSEPQKIWLSRVDDLNNFSSSSGDDGGFAVELNTSTQDPICWMLEQDSRLMLGTTGGEYVLQNGSSDAGAVTAKNAYRARYGRVGSRLMPAWMLGGEVVYVERGDSRVRVFRYFLETNGYRSEDLSVLAPHVLREHGGAVGVTALEKPDRVLVLALGDGQVGLCVYNDLHQVMGWHRWVTDGRVLSVCAMPGAGADADRLWMVVQRDTRAANGTVLRSETCIEVVDEKSPYGVDNGNMGYVSRLRTNDLVPKLEQLVVKRMQRSAKLRLGAALDAGALRFRYNEEDGWQVPDCRELVLEPGWVVLRGSRNAAEEHVVELEVSGRTGCEVLAIQG